MKSFKNHLVENEEVLTESTEGHKYQTALSEKIKSALTPQQREKISIKVAPPGSTLPDISVIHADYPSDPLIIECKMDNAQSGGITWTYDGSKWNFSTKSARAKRMCEIDDPALCVTVIKMVETPLVRNRIDKIQSELGKWFPTLSSKTIPFQACKEFWPTLLDKYTNKAEGGKWQIPVTNTFWKTLNHLMKNDHFLHIKGSGMFRVGGAKLPEWFEASNEYLTKMPIISEVNTPPKGNLELRLKQSGMKMRKLQLGRELHIHSTIQPNVGNHVHVKQLGSMGDTADYRHPVGLFNNRGPATYIVSSSESGSIGQIAKIHSVDEHPSTANKSVGDKIWIVKCDLNHRVGTITFETNLRIIDIDAKSGVNLEDDVNDFILSIRK